MLGNIFEKMPLNEYSIEYKTENASIISVSLVFRSYFDRVCMFGFLESWFTVTVVLWFFR